MQGADLLIHEGNHPNRLAEKARAEGHSFSSAVTAFADAANAKRLIVSHTELCFRKEIIDEIHQKIPTAQLADDGLEIDI